MRYPYATCLVRKSLTVCLIVTLVGLSRGAAHAQDTPPPSPTPAGEVGTEASGERYGPPEGVSASGNPNTLLYTDPQFGFQVAFPADWVTTGGQLVDPYTYVWEVRFTAPGKRLVTMSVSVQPLTDATLSSEAWAAQVLDGLGLSALPRERLEMNGLPALRTDLPPSLILEPNLAARATYLVAGGFGYTLTALVEHDPQAAPDFSVYEALLASFKAGNRTPSLAPRPRDSVQTAATATDFQYPLTGWDWFVDFDVHPSVNHGVWSNCLQAYWQDLWHAGEDWGATAGEAVYAVANGVVAWYDPNYTTYPGRVVIIRHDVYDGTTIYSVYSHLDTANVSAGQAVAKGDLIGTIYNWAGNSHLHWEMRNFLDGTNLCNAGKSVVPGPGYTYPEHPQSKGYTDPTTYVDTHRDGPCPPPPLVSPANGALILDRTVQFNWQRPVCRDLTHYVLRITKKPDPASAALFSTTVNKSKYDHTFSADGIYYWHVAAQNVNYDGLWATRRVTILTDPSAVGPVEVFRMRVDDNTLYDSNGNDDGVINCGETVELYAILGNRGTSPAVGVSATLTSADPYASQFANTSSAYPDLDAGGTGSNSNDFDFDIAPNTPDGHTIRFDVHITAAYGGPWNTSFSLPVTCIAGAEHLINGTLEADANNDGIPDGWKINSSSGASKRVCNKADKDKYLSYAGNCAVRLKSTGSTEALRQTYVPAGGGRAGDAFTLILYAQGQSLPADATAQVKVVIGNRDGTKQTETFALPGGDYTYQRFVNTFVAAQDYDKIKVSVQVTASGGKLYVDNLSLLQTN